MQTKWSFVLKGKEVIKMRRVIIAIIAASFLFPSMMYAGQRCPIEGSSFNFIPEGNNITYELTDFDCSFGPGCCGTCSFWYGDFKLGPINRIPLDFSCRIPRDASPDAASILIANLPCYTDANVTKLFCIPINMKDYHKVKVLNKIFFLPKDVNVIQFNKE